MESPSPHLPWPMYSSLPLKAISAEEQLETQVAVPTSLRDVLINKTSWDDLFQACTAQLLEDVVV